VSAAQAKQHACVQKLLAACESDQQQQQDRHRVSVAGPPAWAKRDGGRRVRRCTSADLPQARAVPRPSTIPAATPSPSRAPPAPFMPPPLASSSDAPPAVPPVAPPVSPAMPSAMPSTVPPLATTPPATEPPPLTEPPPAAPSAVPPFTAARLGPCFLDEPEGRPIGDREQAAASASPEYGPVQTAMDASVAKAVLRDFLSSLVRPCVPPSAAKAAKVQRTLAEVWKGAEVGDVLARSRGDDLCRFQVERRCACATRKGSREGCSFAIDCRFEKELAQFSPAAVRHYVSRGLDAMLLDLKEVLRIPKSAKLQKRSEKVVLYGWRRLE
jgi:hypothetical protein